MTECSVLVAQKNDVQPTHYNDTFNKAEHLKFNDQELEKIETFFSKIKTSIRAAETLGNYVLTDQSRKFPKVDNQYYEPEGCQ